MSLVNTQLQNWRMIDERLDKNMSRPLEYGALDFFVQQTEAPNSIIPSDVRERAFASMGNSVQIPVINYDGDVTVSTSRSCTISDDENTSALYTISWSTYQVGFTMTPAAYLNNEITYERDFQRKMEKVCRALATSLDTAAIAALEAQKTQVFTDALGYTTTGNVVLCPANMRSDILSDINTMMRANAYPAPLHIVGNAGVERLVRKLSEHSIYNEANRTLEFDDKTFHFTTNLSNADNYGGGTFYAIEDGNVAVLTRVDREALRGASALGHEWSVIRLPFIDLPVGSHYYQAVGDQSSIAGAATADLTCGIKEYFGFSVDVAFVTAYNSAAATVANPIIKAQIGDVTGAFAQPVYITNASDFA